MTFELAALIGEYVSLFLADSHDFDRMNSLSFQLLLLLPSDRYKSLGKVMQSSDPKDILDWLCAGTEITSNQVILHARGIGKTRNR